MSEQFGTVTISTSTTGKEEPVILDIPKHTFKSNSIGGYFRDRVVINGVSYHVQIIISTK